MILDGKKLLITGVLDPRSIAFTAARLAQEQGAEVVLTGFGRGIRLTNRSAGRLDPVPDVLEMDVTQPEQVAAVVADLEQRWGRVDGILHAIGFAPNVCIGDDFFAPEWDDVATAMQISTFSLGVLARDFRHLLAASDHGALVGLTFDATVTWPGYNWMGVAKAGLESLSRYLSRELGPDGTRVNLVAAGPLHTMAARSIEGFGNFDDMWTDRAPLGWDLRDPEPVGRNIVALLSDWTLGVTGEILHVDGGVHATGAPMPPADPSDADQDADPDADPGADEQATAD
ncbi:MAG TPA: enoyl-ACP reductase FabI [Nitriliruptoraceae bacterium]|nr:enoyl-ACP reductase FabI [Nitriliruptoraceae bacterium]